jgi:hypothetical protein
LGIALRTDGAIVGGSDVIVSIRDAQMAHAAGALVREAVASAVERGHAACALAGEGA